MSTDFETESQMENDNELDTLLISKDKFVSTMFQHLESIEKANDIVLKKQAYLMSIKDNIAEVSDSSTIYKHIQDFLLGKDLAIPIANARSALQRISESAMGDCMLDDFSLLEIDSMFGFHVGDLIDLIFREGERLIFKSASDIDSIARKYLERAADEE